MRWSCWRNWGRVSTTEPETPILVELSVLRPYEGLDVAAISPKPAFTSGGHPGLAVSAIHSFER